MVEKNLLRDRVVFLDIFQKDVPILQLLKQSCPFQRSFPHFRAPEIHSQLYSIQYFAQHPLKVVFNSISILNIKVVYKLTSVIISIDFEMQVKLHLCGGHIPEFACQAKIMYFPNYTQNLWHKNRYWRFMRLQIMRCRQKFRE